MIAFSFAFLLGDWSLQQQHVLPTITIMLIILLIALLICAFIKNRVMIMFITGFSIGFIYSASYATIILQQRIPHELEGKPIYVEGVIASIPHKIYDTYSFVFDVKRFKVDDKLLSYHPSIKLYFKTNTRLIVGDTWQFYVRLKRIHGLQNPGSSDYEAYALQNKLLATGSVINHQYNKSNHHRFYAPLDYIRQQVFDYLVEKLPASNVKHWLIALMMGERSQVPKEDWEILRRTGTNHLMTIAGLHIGIIAGFIYMIASFILLRVPYIVARIPVHYLALSASLVIGILYAALAGFSIPTQRAAIMLTIATLSLLRQKKILPWQMLGRTVVIVLLINPLVILSDSFWLSFTTIAWIFYCMSGRLAPTGWWWKHGRIQWIIGVGLIPLSLFFFQECSLVSFLANTIAIPWLAFLLLPWLLLSGVVAFISPFISHYLFLYCDWSLSLLWQLLTWMSQLPLASVQQIVPSHYILMTTSIAFIILLMPNGLRGRSLALIWLLPLFSYSAAKPAAGDVWMTLLDVGQGLSVVIKTNNHTLIYDAGPRLHSHDSGESVIIPYLKNQQIDALDIMIISHGDNDHAGGAKSIVNAIKVNQIKTSVPDKINYFHADFCLKNDSWTWDGVVFKILYPSKVDLNLGNDSSCVLIIDTGKHRILLTGDIESYAEETILQSDELLTADILVAPHHGSITSSTEAFIKQVSSRYVLYAVGYRNRYHFPHAIIKERYSALHATQLATDSMGAIEIKLNKSTGIQVVGYRDQHKRYWHNS